MKEIVEWAGGPGWTDQNGNEPPITFAVIEHSENGNYSPIDYDENVTALAIRNGISASVQY